MKVDTLIQGTLDGDNMFLHVRFISRWQKNASLRKTSASSLEKYSQTFTIFSTEASHDIEWIIDIPAPLIYPTFSFGENMKQRHSHFPIRTPQCEHGFSPRRDEVVSCLWSRQALFYRLRGLCWPNIEPWASILVRKPCEKLLFCLISVHCTE